ncbi:disulfide isomerase DsbC N-terminal domain-containing protein, partial [Kaarinaea lacus]
MKKLLSMAQLLLMSTLLVAQYAYAEEDKAIATIKASIQSLGLREQPEKITKSAVPGLYEVVVGQYVLYVS